MVCKYQYNQGMTLKELRIDKKLTQEEAAKLIGISRRSYLDYENNPDKQNGYKYVAYCELLNKYNYVDEDVGIVSLDYIKEKILPVLAKHNINYCYLFGSYARNEARGNSDIDLLVDTDITGLDYFVLIDEIRIATKKKVDLLRLKDISSDNPISLEILKNGIRIK